MILDYVGGPNIITTVFKEEEGSSKVRVRRCDDEVESQRK